MRSLYVESKKKSQRRSYQSVSGEKLCNCVVRVGEVHRRDLRARHDAKDRLQMRKRRLHYVPVKSQRSCDWNKEMTNEITYKIGEIEYFLAICIKEIAESNIKWSEEAHF